MATEYKMPQLGLTMTEGTITKWFKSVGDQVSIGDLLVEVETDKITNQLESPLEGTVLELLVEEGTAAPVQAAIAVIGQPGETIERVSNVAAAAVVASAEAVAEAAASDEAKPAGDGKWIKASPLAKKIASENNVDLAVVTGTGPDGRIIERDILGFIERNKIKATPLAVKVAAEHNIDLSGISKDSRIMKDDVLALIPTAAAQVGAPAPAAATAGTPITGMRKVISERMSLSWHTAPHVNLTVEVDMTGATELKAKLAEVVGTKFSFTEMITKCAAQALVEYKGVNASLINGQIYYHDTVNMGIAVALDNGLIVPVVKNAQQKTLSALREEIRELSGKARKGELGPDAIKGGTFTITNLGMYGVDHFTPIINQPESAILGVCRAVERPVVRNGAIEIRPIMNLCLSFDHRLIDGSVAAQFMNRVRQLLEQPLLLL